MLKELHNQVQEVKKEIEAINEKRDNLKAEINKLELDKQDLHNEIRMKEQREKDRLIPEIERYRKMIEMMKLDIINNETAIEKEQERTIELEVKNEALENTKEELKADIDKLNDEYLNQKDEPARIGK